MQSARAGNETALRRLVESHQHLVFAIARQMGGTASDHEDIAQETFLRAIRGLPCLKDPSRFTAWLCGIAINVSREYRRRQWRFVPWEQARHTHAEAPAVNSSDSAALVELMGRLPEKYRLPLTLRYTEGMSYSQMATILGIPESTARSLVHRGRARLLALARRRGITLA